MNDHFLYQLRKSPRPQFAEALYAKISNPNRSQTMFTRSLKRIGWALAVACLIFALTLVFSPEARAGMQEVIRDIGGMRFNETDQYPGGGDVRTVHEKSVSLEEAQVTLPFPIQLPTWIPEGYQLMPQVSITYFDENYTPVRISWEQPHTSGRLLWIDLYIEQTEGPQIVGLNSLKEFTINGQPAVFVEGMWNANTKQWNSEAGKVLVWNGEQATYHLSGAALSDEEMIRIAESVTR